MTKEIFKKVYVSEESMFLYYNRIMIMNDENTNFRI